MQIRGVTEGSGYSQAGNPLAKKIKNELDAFIELGSKSDPQYNTKTEKKLLKLFGSFRVEHRARSR